jgi:hypothetical protein
MWGQPLVTSNVKLPDNYVVSTDIRLLPKAVAVVFHLPSFNPVRILNKSIGKKKRQLWVAWSMECEAHYPHLSDPLFMNLFDLRMTYHLDADIVVPYFRYELKDVLRKPVHEKKAGKTVNAFISSSYDKSGRVAYLKKLMEHIDAHSYGKLFHNKTMKNDTGHLSKMDILAEYKFSLAFENAIAQDYVTEKFYDPLVAGSVPVYLGAPNINAFAPGDKCFVNVSEWESPETLAEYLLFVSNNESEYQSYFNWKTKPFHPYFLTLLEQLKEHVFVRLCKKISENYAENTY